MSWNILCGDAVARMAELPTASVQTIVTSPPYYNLRDYKIDGQIGLEPTPALFVAEMVRVFEEAWRVLRDDGTLWLNLGDSYANDGKWGGKHAAALHGNTAIGRRKIVTGLKPKNLIGIPWRVAFALQDAGWYLRSAIIWHKPNPLTESVTDRPSKSYEHIFLLTKNDRYYYDADAISEPVSEAMLEQLRAGYNGKATKDYASAGAQDPSAVKARILARSGNKRRKTPAERGCPEGTGNNQCGNVPWEGYTRNIRDVWTITTQSYPDDDHFAAFPEELPSRCIKAGSRPAGKRCDCDTLINTPLGTGGDEADPSRLIGRAGYNRPRNPDEGTRPITRREQREYALQLRESPWLNYMRQEAGADAFDHYVRTDLSGARPVPPELLNNWRRRGWLMPPTPCDCPDQPADVVLDPFCGRGTTGVVAERLGRDFIGIDLNPAHVEMSRRNLSNTLPLFPA